jgi:hypothetical protein
MQLSLRLLLCEVKHFSTEILMTRDAPGLLGLLLGSLIPSRFLPRTRLGHSLTNDQRIFSSGSLNEIGI